MSLVPQPAIRNLFISSSEADPPPTDLETTEAVLGSLLGALTATGESMDRSGADYPSQQGSQSQYPTALPDAQLEESSTPHASTTQYAPQSGLKSQTDSPPEYTVYPTSARSSTFAEHIQRQTHPSSNHSGSSGGMPQSASPSLPLQDGRPNHQHPQTKSDREVPIDPSIATSSPTYPPHNAGAFSPYPPHPEMSHSYAAHPAGAMYTQPRPDWAGYAGHASHPQHPMPGGYAVTGAQSPSVTAPTGSRQGQVRYFHHPNREISRMSYSSAPPCVMQSGDTSPLPVYSFVPIPGAQQHKRPRRRYEEIERMYKCGWNGCEKAYGTLNHLNAHVTMQSHGSKRTPEEFKEIRKEWKARKKEEENQRKAEEDRNHTAIPNESHADAAPSSGYPQPGRTVQLPPIAYQPGAQVPNPYQASSSPGVQQQLQQEFNQGQLTYSGYPASPYGAAPNQMYNQRHYTPSPPRPPWTSLELTRFLDNGNNNAGNGGGGIGVGDGGSGGNGSNRNTTG